MQAFLSSALYKSLPGIALALDEGLASMDDTYSLFYGERLPWWVDVTATGRTGHGSRFIDHTAVEQIVGVSNRAPGKSSATCCMGPVRRTPTTPTARTQSPPNDRG